MLDHVWTSPAFWNAIAFILFIILLGPRIYRQITQFLDERTHKIKAEFDNLAELKVLVNTELSQAKRTLNAAKLHTEELYTKSQEELIHIHESTYQAVKQFKAISEKLYLQRTQQLQHRVHHEIIMMLVQALKEHLYQQNLQDDHQAENKLLQKIFSKK